MNQLAKYIIGLAVAAVIGFIVWYFSDIVGYILISAVLAVMGHPLMVLLGKFRVGRFSLPMWVQALITLLVILGVAVLFFALFIPLLSSKLSQLSQVDFSVISHSFEEPLAKFQKFLHEYFAIDTAGVAINEMVEKQFSSIINMGRINDFFSSIVSVVVDAGIALFSIIFITFFFLKEDNLFTNMVLSIFPSKYEGNINRALKSVTYLLSRYFVGIVAESVIMMLVVSLGLLCFGFGMSDAFFVGLVIGVLNVIPYIGCWIGFGISAFACTSFVVGTLSVGHMAMIIAGVLLCAKMFDDFVIQPFIYSNQVSAHPLEIFLVILIAGSIAGVLGMLLAIPAYTVLRVFAREFFNNFKLVQKLTENLPM